MRQSGARDGVAGAVAADGLEAGGIKGVCGAGALIETRQINRDALWSAVTRHRFCEATCRRRMAGGVGAEGGVHGSRQRGYAGEIGRAWEFDGDKSPARKR